MMAMPICDSMVTERLLLKTDGASSSTRANSDQMIERPTFQGLNS